MSLKDRLIEQIRQEGPIPFEEFQQIALYDPEGGFFASGKLRSVKEGDFLTSPEVSSLFGETLAKFVDGLFASLSGGGAEPPFPSPSGGDIERPFPSPSGGDIERPFPSPSGGGAERLFPSPSGGGAERLFPSPSGGSGLGEERAGVDGGGFGAGVDGGGATLVEVGAGSGTLLRPLLAALEHPVDAWAVEASPAARAALAEVLPSERVVPVFDDVAAPFSGVIIGNELLDNLPVSIAVRKREGWEERWVGIEDGRLVLVAHPVRPKVAGWADQFGRPCPEGGRVEVQLAASEWIRRALDMLVCGAVIVIDYGETAENLEHRRTEGTLRTYRAHHLGPHALAEPGETDITVDVNFSPLVIAAESGGASVELHRQDEFLQSLGLVDRIRELREQELALARDGDPMERLKVRSTRTNAETLLHRRGLGDFRVLIARK
ncbi:MAG TPA: hypothetical protein ENH33_09625 [Actinobacteria bacterium]|nr:hypothetical protein [Actinomycetota bacterium]